MVFTLQELNNSPMTSVVKGGMTTNTKGETEWHPAKPVAWNGMKLRNRIKAAWRAQVIVSKEGDGAELVEDTGLRIEVSHPDGMKRRHAEMVFARLGWYRYGSWSNAKFGYTAEFRRR